MSDNDASANWRQASGQWSAMGSPQRPGTADIDAARQVIAGLGGPRDAPPVAAILGVTPELASLPWPTGTRLLAIDNSRPMIDALWPAPGAPAGARAICADWRAMPIADGALDAVVGDGCYAAVALPDEGQTVSRELRRTLRPNGIVAIRTYLRPAAPDDLEALRARLAGGGIGSVHALKWLIAFAVQPSTAVGAKLADIWDAWQSLAPAAAALAGRPGWRAEEIASLGRYRGNTTRYHFPTIDEFRAIFADDLQEAACITKDYELGDLCPTFILRPR
ncbi:MAG: class I SAM-dependent methyltransferase [Alphaproteobacteria bacterium]